eukprot:1156777-Pelagomonas_calceolata.AAC.2
MPLVYQLHRMHWTQAKDALHSNEHRMLTATPRAHQRTGCILMAQDALEVGKGCTGLKQA